MKKNKWNKWYDRCVVCGSTDIEYCGNGMCKKCYWRIRYKDPKVKQYYKDKTNEWRLKHPKRWMEIHQKAVNKSLLLNK